MSSVVLGLNMKNQLRASRITVHDGVHKALESDRLLLVYSFDVSCKLVVWLGEVARLMTWLLKRETKKQLDQLLQMLNDVR